MLRVENAAREIRLTHFVNQRHFAPAILRAWSRLNYINSVINMKYISPVLAFQVLCICKYFKRFTTCARTVRHIHVAFAYTRFMLPWLSFRWAWKLKCVSVTGRSDSLPSRVHSYEICGRIVQNDITHRTSSNILRVSWSAVCFPPICRNYCCRNYHDGDINVSFKLTKRYLTQSSFYNQSNCNIKYHDYLQILAPYYISLMSLISSIFHSYKNNIIVNYYMFIILYL